MNYKIKITIIVIAVLFFTISILTAGLSMIAPPVRAVVLTANNFDSTDIEDDLADIDLSEFTKDPDASPRLFQLVEYCYTDNAFKWANYGLYFYIYNPAQTNYSIKNGENTVNIAITYNDSGTPASYANMSLTYLSKTTSAGFENLFYKFKVTDAAALLTLETGYNKTHGVRRYDVSGVQLRELSTGDAKDCRIAYSFRYTGYAKGYGTAAESTLDCQIEELETVDLKIKSTFYRPEGHNSDGVYTQDQLTSVYFAVPNKTKDRYDRLYSVRAEWYRALTSKIFVTDSKNAYDAIYPYLGRIDSGNAGYGFGAQMGDPRYDVYYNDYRSEILEAWNGALSKLDYIFLVERGETVTATDYTISAEDLRDFILLRSADCASPFLGKYDRSMFAELDETKTVVDVKADDKKSLTGIVANRAWWDIFHFGGLEYVTNTYDGIEAIKEVTAKDFIKDKYGKPNEQATCDHLYIDKNDYTEFADFYAASVLQDKTVYLLRFDQTQYVSVPVKQWHRTTDLFGNTYNGAMQFQNGYVAQVPAYLDFDIISLTYEKSGEYFVIPVVADPIDIFSDVTAPPNWEPTQSSGCTGLPQWLIIVIIVVGCLLLLPVIIALLPQIIKLVIFLVKWIFIALWYIVSAPFRLIAWISKKVQERPQNSENVETSSAMKTAKAPKTPKAPKAPKTPKTQKAPKVKTKRTKIK